MQNRFKAAWVWLRRIGHCRGFGIQSPWAYRFVRYVVNEHSDYYAYETLTKQLPCDWMTRKMGRLFFRLANYWQPVAVQGVADDTLWAYLKAGCQRAERVPGTAPMPDVRRMLVVSPDDEAPQTIQPDGQTMLVVMGIGYRDAAAKLWQTLLDDQRARTTFDLYYCGIAFFETRLYKKNYIVNF